MNRTIRLHPDDNVDIALADLAPGDHALNITLTEAVKRGHKLANQPIAKGGLVRRYGQIIGGATMDIPAGAHVHVQNLAMSDHSHDYAFASEAKPLAAATELRTFQGFRRSDGKAGTRNYLGVLTSVNCSGSVARFIAEEAEKTDWFRALKNVDGIVPIAHSSGCGMAGIMRATTPCSAPCKAMPATRISAASFWWVWVAKCCKSPISSARPACVRMATSAT